MLITWPWKVPVRGVVTEEREERVLVVVLGLCWKQPARLGAGLGTGIEGIEIPGHVQ